MALSACVSGQIMAEPADADWGSESRVETGSLDGDEAADAAGIDAEAAEEEGGAVSEVRDAWADDGRVPAVDGDAATIPSTCGNRIVEPPEHCDDGNDVDTDLCRNNCLAPQCGDGVVWEGREECDDGNTEPGDGCRPGCLFSCRTDAECDNGLVCDGVERCSVAHACIGGTSISDGSPCAGGGSCREGRCAAAACGNGVRDVGEACDDGNRSNGDACNADCTLPCTADAACDDGDACNGAERCDAASHVCVRGPRAAPGTWCWRTVPDSTTRAGGVCMDGACVRFGCGDGVLEEGELCDTAIPTPIGVCRSCAFGCWPPGMRGPAPDPCQGTCLCDPYRYEWVCGPALPNGTEVPRYHEVRAFCTDGRRMPSRCGDGVVDAYRLEDCEPPGPLCSATSCTRIVDGCGDGAIRGSEQCDDGNSRSEDGCSADCRHEQVLRASWAAINGPLNACDLTGDLIPDNAVGRALAVLALTAINGQMQDSIQFETTNVMFQLMDLDDLRGQNDPAMRVAIFNGRIDEWPGLDVFEPVRYWGDPLDFIPFRQPLWVLPAARVSGGTLQTGTGNARLVLFDGMYFRYLRVQRTSVTARLVADSVTGRVGNMGTASQHGRICGVVPASALDAWISPERLPDSCAVGTRRSLLDVLALGCAGLTGVVLPTQPDIDLGGDGITGLLSGFPFSDTNGDGVIDTCRDGSSGRVIRGDDCAQDPAFDDGYSLSMDFTAVPTTFRGIH